MPSQTAIVNLGFIGVDKDNQSLNTKLRGKIKSMTEQERKLLKRRQSIEPIIGHLKVDYRINQSHLKGFWGRQLASSALLSCTSYNPRWLLRMITRKGIWLFCAC